MYCDGATGRDSIGDDEHGEAACICDTRAGLADSPDEEHYRRTRHTEIRALFRTAMVLKLGESLEPGAVSICMAVGCIAPPKAVVHEPS